MKLATYTHRGRQAVGIVDLEQGQVRTLDTLGGGAGTALDMLGLVREFGASLDKVRAAGQGSLALAEITLDAPFPRPLRNIMCVGKNYHAHAREFTRSGFDSSATSKDDAVPTAPIIFTKPPESVIGDGAPIRYPHGVSDSVDYEAELAVVIGKQGRGIERSRSQEHVFDYTIVNDVTARDWQGRHKQWFLGKSFDTFCPMGPWIVTADEIDASNLTVRCWVNDELRQDANTRDLIFDIPTLIATISAGITLYPGDIIATGTPAGVGIGFDPPKYLKPADRVRITIEGIGALTNRVE